MSRAAWIDVDLDAVAANVAALAEVAAPARLCSVVKADGYGHGSVPVAQAALAAGATWLAVAIPDEALALRDAGIDAPVMLLSEPEPRAFADVAAAEVRSVAYTPEGVAAAAAAASPSRPLRLHLKVDTGMRRVGCQPGEAAGLARRIAGEGSLELEGVCTHLAVADEPDHPFTTAQLDRFAAVLADLEGDGLRPPLRHAANSAATLLLPEARFDLVRVGIACYGVPPSPQLRSCLPLRPAMRVSAQVSFVKRVAAGEGISYGLRHTFERPATVATVPLGYADGVTRALGLRGGEVLVGGRRRPIAGVVTMDQFMVDCGDDEVRPGDEVVLLGRQGDEEITADEWAERLGTIAYEVVCGFSARPPRRYP